MGFGYRERVHVRPQGDGGAVGGTSQQADNARRGYVSLDFQAYIFKYRCDLF